MMKFLKEYGFFIFVILAALVFIHKLSNKNDRLHGELIGSIEKYKQLTDHVAKLEIKYKTQEELQKKLEAEWANQKSELEGRVKVLSNATYLIRQKARREDNSDLVYKGDKFKYVFNELRFDQGPPIGYVMIFDNGKVTSKIYNHVIDVKTAISRDESSGRYSILSKADYILKSPHFMKPGSKNWFNKPYPLNIIGGTATIDPTEKNHLSKRFHLWAPNFNLGIDFIPDPSPSLGVSFAGYGYTPGDLDWKFLQIGMNYFSERIGFHFIPVLYRPIPGILRNTYIGPGIGSIGSIPTFLLGINVGL